MTMRVGVLHLEAASLSVLVISFNSWLGIQTRVVFVSDDLRQAIVCCICRVVSSLSVAKEINALMAACKSTKTIVFEGNLQRFPALG